MLHAATNVTYTSDTSNYCGQSGLTDCSSATETVDADPNVVTVFYLIAAFPDYSEPRVLGLNFGLNYSADNFVLLANGSCADFELPTSTWPAPASGNAVQWTATQTGSLTEVHWFAGYAYSAEVPTTVAVTAHPDHGLTFADDSVPSVLDPVTSAGVLGFGVSGSNPNCDHFGSGTGPTTSSTLAFVELADTTASTFIKRVQDLREEYGLRVRVGLSPDGFLCDVEPGMIDLLSLDTRVSLTTNTLIAGERPVTDAELTVGDPRFARRVWNDYLQSPPADTSGAGFFNPGNGCADNPVPVLPLNQPHQQTSTFLVGDVGLTLIVVESADDGPCENPARTENWTVDETNTASSRVFEALDKLVTLAGEQHVAIFLAESPTVEVSIEPIQFARGDPTWRLEALAALGYIGSDHLALAFALNNDRRAANKVDWWVTSYLIRDVCDLDHAFPGQQYSGADIGGPSITLLYWNGGEYPPSELDNIMMHEMCHPFGAVDEYNQFATCTGPYGYLRAENRNRVDCTTNLPCMMKDNQLDVLCSYTRDQIGWRDKDADGPFDPIDNQDAVNSSTLGIGEPLAFGDNVDIYLNSTFVRRLAASTFSMHSGVVLWDGIGFDGLPRSAGTYELSRNNGPHQSFTLAADVAAPQILSVELEDDPESVGSHYLDFVFSDSDTHAGRLRATALPQFPGVGPTVEVLDKFYGDNLVHAGPHRERFALGHSGIYDLMLEIWDVGGGNKTSTVIEDFWHGPVSDVQGGPSMLDLRSVSLGTPNPSPGHVNWRLTTEFQRDALLRVYGPDGRVVRSWSQHLAPGANQVSWNGRDNSGRAVSSGCYYLAEVTRTGVDRLGMTTIVR